MMLQKGIAGDGSEDLLLLAPSRFVLFVPRFPERCVLFRAVHPALRSVDNAREALEPLAGRGANTGVGIVQATRQGRHVRAVAGPPERFRSRAAVPEIVRL